MNERAWNVCKIVIAAGLVTVFFDWRITTGYLLGCLGAVLLYKRNEVFWNDVVDMNNVHRGTGMFHFLINYAIMAGIMILCALFPQYANIFASAVGLSVIKISTIISEVFRERGKAS